ncbi:MAG: hypothetical protein KGJ66_02505 [Alphaproteobacteria bacterium]|nr:hypothetical protein [Alphaproteobacteria bacterium]
MTIEISGARIVTVHGGRGPPVLLMHGNPFTHVSWHQGATGGVDRNHRPSTSGASTRATFAAPKRCLAVITCRSNARRKRRWALRSFFAS